MNKILSNRLLPMICFLLSVAIIPACKKETNATSDKVALYSFGPTGAMHGDTIRFIGNRLDQVTAIDFTGASVAQASFVSQTAEEIKVKVPDQATQGFVTLRTAQGDIVTKTKFNLHIAIQVTTMTAQARPGENITISGKYLNWVTAVTFASDKIVDSFVSQSLTELVVKVPMDAQTGPLVLSYGGTDPFSMQTQDTLKVTLPAITSIAPNPVKHQSNLTITGTNLDLVKQIVFTGVATPVTAFVSQTATSIVVKVPQSTRKGKISLVVASGVAVESTQELNVVLPAITTMAPNPIDTGANLTINGSNLDLVSGISFVGIANPVTTFVSQSATKLVVKVPGGSLKGKLVFKVKNSTLTVESPGELVINGGLPPLAPFAYAIYTDGTENGFQDWSYTDVHDFNSTANVRQGTKSVRAQYAAGGYQGVTFHAAGTVPSTASYSKLEFSVFGEPGTGGKKLNVVINGNYGSPTQVTVKEGEWATFSLDFSAIGNPATMGEVVLQSAGWGGVLHIDHVGMR